MPTIQAFTVITVISLALSNVAFGEDSSNNAQSNNPQNDPDVDRGIKEYQKEYEQRQRDNEAQKVDGQPRNEEQWKNNQYPKSDDDKFGVKKSHDQPQN